MKIKIITCHFVHNYGAVLQALALSNMIRENIENSDVEIIDYRPNYLATPHKVFHVGSDKYRKNFFIKFLYIVRTFPYRYKTYINFKRFVKSNLKLSKKRYTSYEELKKYPPDADLYICGSDQIWNYRVDNGKDNAFYCNFISKDKKKIAYAPSFGVSDITEIEKELLRKMIHDFNNISIREDAGQQILEEIGFGKVPIVLDPVFLLSKKEWDKTLKPIKQNTKFILIYKITRNTALYEFANCLAKIIDAEVIEIGFSAKCDGKVDKYLCGIDPQQFLSYIKEADYIVTDSFHGVAFSIIYSKQFTVFNRGALNSRITSLLSIVNLNDRFFKKEISPIEHYNDRIDYSYPLNELEKYILESKKYLLDGILNDK